jgi:hypothetical protein
VTCADANLPRTITTLPLPNQGCGCQLADMLG